jgi:amidohydrolase
MEKLLKSVDKYRQLILDAERYIWANPETGYKEVKTTKYLAEKYEEIGYKLTYAENITGFYTTIDTGREGPTILILGELDSVICPSHPESDPVTGAVHSCGHNAQSATLLGIAAALTEPNVLDDLSGKIKLCAVPAEELLEIEYRQDLVDKGIIKHMGGKSEFMARGYFDDVDLAFMVHTDENVEEFNVNNGHVGCIAKKITYKGVSAHAGGSPWNGKNALYAATNGLNSANALRETFRERDLIRFHPIITKGGSMVNAIPEEVIIESYVRGATFEAIKNANVRINQALIGSALSIGCNVDIQDIPGYAPDRNNKDLIALSKVAYETAFPNKKFIHNDRLSTGSTDMGDLSSVMPTIHAYAPGAIGLGHGNNYYIVNPESACVDSAKFQLALLYMLLSNGGKKAREIIDNNNPTFKSIKEYLDYVDALNRKGDRITYSENSATIDL